MGKRLTVSLVAVVALLAIAVRAQHQHSGAAASSAEAEQQLGTVTSAMSSHDHGHDHQMGPHMHMSTLRDPKPADTARAQQIVDTARASLERYKDVKVAEANGFKIFLPE